jgi:conjugative transposon TraN protein
MKAFVIFSILLLSHFFACAQTIEISTDKTTSLVFPFAIRHVDRGTAAILVQDIPDAANILLVKAGTSNFEPTNLSVVTTDGSVYTFLVQYNPCPAEWVVYVPVQQQTAIQTYANAIAINLLTMRGIRDRSYDMEARVSGIYIKDQVIYYQLRLTNTSPIDYDIHFLRFYIRDQKRNKRTASQENELPPLYVAGNTHVVKGCSHNTVVVALEKFTIPDAKYLAIEINEHNGGRHLLLKVHNNKIIKAIALPDLK